MPAFVVAFMHNSVAFDILVAGFFDWVSKDMTSSNKNWKSIPLKYMKLSTNRSDDSS